MAPDKDHSFSPLEQNKMQDTDLLEEPIPACDNTLEECPVTASEPKMPTALGVRLSQGEQMYFVTCADSSVARGVKILVEVEHGLALGEVATVYYSELGTVSEPFVPDGAFISFATAKDIAIHTENNLQAAEAAAFCKSCIRQHSLDMKLVDVIVLHDKSKIVFFFTAPFRIDFRDLVKDLVRNYHTRIELRQIGVRHETQMLGGVGACGSVCCCKRFLRKFAPVTIRMAKDQNLFLNPAKLSGLCGRLLCCLAYEQENYEEFNRRSPRIGKKYFTEDGTMRVLRSNMFNNSIVCLQEDGEEKEYSFDNWEMVKPKMLEHTLQKQQRNKS